MKLLNITVKGFVDHFVPSTETIRITKRYETMFEGTIDEFYYYGSCTWNEIVAMVGTRDGVLCLACRE